MAALLRFEMEQAGVVAVVGLLEELAQARVDAVAVDEGAEAAVVFDAAVFADAQEDDAVNDALDGEVEFALGELGVAQGEVAGELVAPALDVFEEGVVDVGGAALGLGGFGELVERAFEDGLAGEDAGDLVPALGVLGVGGVEDAAGGGCVVFGRA